MNLGIGYSPIWVKVYNSGGKFDFDRRVYFVKSHLLNLDVIESK